MNPQDRLDTIRALVEQIDEEGGLATDHASALYRILGGERIAAATPPPLVIGQASPEGGA